MLKFLKKSLLKIILITLFSFQSMAGDLTIVENGYGKRGWDVTKYENIKVHPLSKYYGHYFTSDFKRLDGSSKFNASVNLSIKKEKKNILAVVSIKNLGGKSFFIREIEFPSSFASLKHNENTISISCRMSFYITTGNIILDYIGALCDYMGNNDKEDWTEFSPGVERSYTVVLNDSFEFIPGKKYYNIGTTEYNVVNDDWFLERSMYSYFFDPVNNSV